MAKSAPPGADGGVTSVAQKGGASARSSEGTGIARSPDGAPARSDAASTRSADTPAPPARGERGANRPAGAPQGVPAPGAAAWTASGGRKRSGRSRGRGRGGDANRADTAPARQQPARPMAEATPPLDRRPHDETPRPEPLREPPDALSRPRDRRADRGPGDPPLYAALDLGTNNCRLLVAEPWHQSFRVVDAFSRIVRLGEGLSRTGRLSEAAQDRAIEALRVCRGKLDGKGIVRSRLVATEACRAADNGVEFLERVSREAGLELEILTRETEARLAVAGCANLIDWTSDGVLLFDIGGGSSELVWLEFEQGRRHGGDPTRHIRAWTSLPVGVATLSERHGGVAVGPSIFEDMVADVEDLLTQHADWGELDERLRPDRYHMLGTSGTVTTLAGVHLGLKRYDRRRVDGTWLADDEVGAMIDRLLAMDFDDRVANPCIGGDRADLVLAGCAILEAIRRRWRCDRLRVADRGLREGMLTELMIGDGVWRRANRWPRRG